MNKLFIALLLGIAIFQPAFSAPDMAPLPDASSVIQFQSKEPVNELDKNVDKAIENSTKEVITPHVEDVKVMNPNANEEVRKIVLKDTNESLKFTIKKFLGAMAGVVISSVIIFLVLLVMNKFNLSSATKGMGFPKEPNDDVNPFKIDNFSLTGENEALRLFLEKTK